MIHILLMLFIWYVESDGYYCAQYQHRKDRTAFGQTCYVYPWPYKYIGGVYEYWELTGYWKVWSDCRACGSPFHNFTDTKIEVIKGKRFPPIEDSTVNNSDISEASSIEKVGSDPTTLNHCCIYGEPPYFDGPDFLASAINPETGDICEETKYQFSLMGEWYTSHFDSPLSWCFWQSYIVTEL